MLATKTAACLALAGAVTAIVLAPPPNTAAQVDAIFAEWNRPDSPGCSVAVSRNGGVVYERGYGMANIEQGVAIAPETVFAAASVSKQFTAMSILLLAHRGQLSLDDEVTKFIPHWVYREHRVTIRHLLTHTSGLRDAFLLLALAGVRQDGPETNDSILRILARQRGLNFTPGAEYEYNNGGYNLLGGIVKRVSGQSLREVADANIFRPLGMTRTRFRDDPSLDIPNRATGYSREGRDWRAICADCSGIVGNAGLFTTVGDLLLWEHNFSDIRVGDAALLAEMQTPAALASGQPTSYGLGLEIGEHRGMRAVGHGGGDRGIATQVVRYPGRNLAIALLCNSDAIAPIASQLAGRVADIYLGYSGSPPPVPAPALLSAEQLASIAGQYTNPANSKPEDAVRVVAGGGKLTILLPTSESVEVTPVSPTRFIVPGTPIAVEFFSGEMRVLGFGPAPEVLRRLPPFTLSAASLREFTGRYASPELDAAYTILPRPGGLMIRFSGAEDPARREILLEPLSQDRFGGNRLIDFIAFLRDARGAVAGFTARSPGLRGLRFERVESARQ